MISATASCTRRFRIDGSDVDPRRHDLAHRRVFQAEDAADHLALVLFDVALGLLELHAAAASLPLRRVVGAADVRSRQVEDAGRRRRRAA